MTTVIPDKLKLPGIKFVLIEKASKKPFEKDWTNKEYYWNSTRLLTHLSNGGNYGVMGGGEKNLLILDFDNAVVQDQLCSKLPKTFTVKTGSGLLHKYFFSDHAESYKGFDENMNTLFDVQGIGKQVIGPGSIHPNGKTYEVIDDSDIATIGYAELKAFVMPFDKKPKRPTPDSEKPENKAVPAEYRDDTFLEQIKSKVTMEQVMAHIGVDTSKNPSNCFMHASKGGQCLGWNNVTWNCFHCNEKGNIFTAIQKWKHCTFKEALEVLAELGGMSDELKQSRKEYIEKQRKSADHERNIVIEQVSNMLNGKNKNFNGATEIMVDFVLRNNHIYTTKDDIKSEMWIYQEGIYSPNGRSEVKEIVRTILLDNFTMMLCNQVISKIEADTYIDAEKFFHQEYLYEVPVKNGILNILTRELSPFSSDKVFFNKLPVIYDVEAKCEKIDKFIQDVLATENDKKMIYELAGYCLLKEYRFEKAFIFVAGGRNGKCQVKGSKVLMSDGNFKNVEDIRIGDEVLSPQIDGGYKFAKVIEVHNRFENDIYEVREQNRKKRLLYTCANNHLIPVIRTDKYNGERKLYHYEAQDLAKMYNGNSETCVFSTSAVEYKQPDSIINPYCFGAWLGDGHFSERKQKYKIKNIKRDRGSHGNYTNKSLGITTADKEVINEFEKVYPGIVMNTSTKKNNKASTYSFSVIGDFAKELIRLNQNAKGSEFKFIPKECLLSSIEYRKNLLAGLIDTDGYIDKVGQITYCTKSKQLAEDIKNLVFSLGGYADIRDIKKKAQNGFIGEYKDISIRFQNKTMIPLRTWKTSRLKDTKHDPRNIGINVVKKSDGEQVYGFELDSKQTSSQWYVTDNWIVTHNSKLIELIKRLVGLENCSGLPLASLNPESFSISELFGKMVNIASDISSNELKDTSVFKTLTGRDPISAKRKFLRDLTFANYAKMIFACNTLPMVQDTSRGFFDRWVLLNFPYTFVPKEEYDSTEDKSNLKIRDEDIITKITSEEEMSGFLNSALDGLKRLLENRGFTYEASVDEVKNNWIRKSNSFAAFCNDNIVQDYNGIISKKDLRRKYVAYCKKFKLLSKSDFVIKTELQNVFGANDAREEIMGQYTHVWEGISWNEAALAEQKHKEHNKEHNKEIA
jgi:putative DNA primase/helicase